MSPARTTSSRTLRPRRRQRGMSFGVVLVVIVLVVFFVRVAIAMVPAYTGFWQVQSIMDGLPERPEIIAKGPRGIMQSISTQLGINNIDSVSRNDFKLERVSDGLNLALSYEVRKHLIANVDVVMAFDHAVLLEAP